MRAFALTVNVDFYARRTVSISQPVPVDPSGPAGERRLTASHVIAAAQAMQRLSRRSTRRSVSATGRTALIAQSVPQSVAMSPLVFLTLFGLADVETIFPQGRS